VTGADAVGERAASEVDADSEAVPEMLLPAHADRPPGGNERRHHRGPVRVLDVGVDAVGPLAPSGLELELNERLPRPGMGAAGAPQSRTGADVEPLVRAPQYEADEGALPVHAGITERLHAPVVTELQAPLHSHPAEVEV